MIGGRFKIASVASVAAAGLFMGGVSAQAADLGGNCCADLEERVAELEATTARKGNRKVSLEVSGHVHEGILLWDDGEDSGAYIGTINYSRTRFRFKGSAKINADWSAGFLIEVGLRQTGNSSGWDQGNGNPDSGNPSGGLDIRHQALYVKSKSIGTVWLGHTSIAVDGIADICLGCPISSTHESNLGWGGFETRLSATGAQSFSWAQLGAGNNVASDGARRQVLKYVSPTVAGFSLSADWGAETVADGNDRWSAALRYAGEFGAIRVAGGIGYFQNERETKQQGSTTVFAHDAGADVDGWGASLSMQHTPTGLFIAGSYGERTDDGINAGRDTANGWSIIGGVAGKWSTLGKTTLWVRYGEYEGAAFDSNNGGLDDTQGDSEVISLGVNQKIDAAAMEVYVSYYHIEGDINAFGVGATLPAGTNSVQDFDAVLFGARIKF